MEPKWEPPEASCEADAGGGASGAVSVLSLVIRLAVILHEPIVSNYPSRLSDSKSPQKSQAEEERLQKW